VSSRPAGVGGERRDRLEHLAVSTPLPTARATKCRFSLGRRGSNTTTGMGLSATGAQQSGQSVLQVVQSSPWSKSQVPSPQTAAGQSCGQLAVVSPGLQKPSPHTAGQSEGQLAALSSELQAPSPQRWQSKSALDGAGQFELQRK
jgi:hypothetical protein